MPRAASDPPWCFWSSRPRPGPRSSLGAWSSFRSAPRGSTSRTTGLVGKLVWEVFPVLLVFGRGP